MPIFEVNKFNGGISDYEDRGIVGSFKFGSNLSYRGSQGFLTCGQALIDEGLLDYSQSPSLSQSPSTSVSPSSSGSPTPSPSSSTSQSSSPSSSASPSTGASPSPSPSPSATQSPSSSASPSASPSPSPSPSTGLASVFDDLIRWFVEAKDGYAYGFGNTGSIYRRDGSGAWTRVYKDQNGNIKGAAQWYSDGGVTYLFWATDTQLNKKDIFGDSSWNDVEIVGSLDSADWHTMAPVGGALMIANGSKIAYVGYDQSFTPEAQDLIPGNLIKTIVERDGRGIFGTHSESDTSRGVNGAIDSEIYLAQIGDDGELFYANMADQTPILRFPGGGKVNPGGVTNDIKQVSFFEYEEGASSWTDKQVVGNLALFGVWGAESGKNGVYSYGRKKKNEAMTLNLDFELDVDEIGAVITLSGTTLVSYRDGTSYGVKSEDPDTKAVGTYQSLLFKSPIKRPQSVTNYKMVEVYFEPLPNGCSVELWYKVNKSGSFVRANTDAGQVAFGTANAQSAVFLVGANAQMYEKQLVLRPFGNEAPKINRVRTYFD